MGYRLDRFVEEIRSRMPLREEVRALRLAPGVPVLHLVRTAYAADGRAVEVWDGVMSSDVYVLSSEHGYRPSPLRSGMSPPRR
ncbi:UTRA domain-containing protein [Microbispora rosea]|uniref:UTRA domain-containing protein n=1 Tax=Microbispora rosea TaxID=58117 RepID=UPI003792BDDF